MICKHKKLNDQTVILVNKVNWFQVLLFNTNNSIKHQSHRVK